MADMGIGHPQLDLDKMQRSGAMRSRADRGIAFLFKKNKVTG